MTTRADWILAACILVLAPLAIMCMVVARWGLPWH
jgi:hypothetical protein